MKATISYDKKGNKILTIDGRVVTQAEFDQAIPSKPFEPPMATMAYDSSKPLIGSSGGCHPKQVAEFNAELKKRNITGAMYLPDGRVMYTSRKGRKEACRARGDMIDMDGGYGDA